MKSLKRSRLIGPTLSLVVPALNEGQNIQAFLASVYAQACRPFDVVIVDGGSQDSTVERILSWRPFLHITLLTDTTRNIGFIRNLGARAARGDVLFHTNSDVYLPPGLLATLVQTFRCRPDVGAVCGRTRPAGKVSVLCSLAYAGYDALRVLAARIPAPARMTRPGGSFLAIRRSVFWQVGGFPQVQVNEDGHLGRALDRARIKTLFQTGLYVDHRVRRFETAGNLKALGFYIYVLGNFWPLGFPFNRIEQARRLRT